MSLSSRPRVLQASFACDPTASMESRLSWHRAVESAKEFDTWVICQPLKHDALGRDLPPRPHIDGLTICEVPPAYPRLANTPGLFYTAYHAYQKRVLEKACQLHAQAPFDLTHQVSFCGFREPGYLWKLDAKFIWGPVGGTQNYPAKYLTQLSLKAAVSELARSCLNRWHLQCRRRVRDAATKASYVFAANSTAKRDLRRFHSVDAELQLETGIEKLPDWNLRSRRASDPLRILWSGRLCHWKSLPLLLRSLDRTSLQVPFELRILGHGPAEESCKRLVDQLGIQDSVAFVDWPVYEQQLQHYEWADVFAFSSLRDTSGTGLIEALANGCPLVAVDHQGAKDIMTDECGIRIPVETPANTISAFANAFTRLARSPKTLSHLSHGARRRAERYLWSGLGKRMRQVYHQVIGDSPIECATDQPVLQSTS